MLRNARALDRRLDTKIPTAKLNATIISLADRTPPPRHRLPRLPRSITPGRLRTGPFRLKLFCNQERNLTGILPAATWESGLVREFGPRWLPDPLRSHRQEKGARRATPSPTARPAWRPGLVTPEKASE